MIQSNLKVGAVVSLKVILWPHAVIVIIVTNSFLIFHMLSDRQHLSAGLQLRLQSIQNNVNHHILQSFHGSGQMSTSLSVLRKWLHCAQFKMAQVEIQSSEAASQFYPL